MKRKKIIKERKEEKQNKIKDEIRSVNKKLMKKSRKAEQD